MHKEFIKSTLISQDTSNPIQGYSCRNIFKGENKRRPNFIL